MAVSKDLMLAYKERETEGIDLSVTVLTTGYWPSYPTDSVIIPAQVCGVKRTISLNTYFLIELWRNFQNIGENPIKMCDSRSNYLAQNAHLF